MKEPGQIAWETAHPPYFSGPTWKDAPPDTRALWARVEAAIRADERERCARVAEQYEPRCETDAIAAAIRALTNGDPK